MNNDTRMPAAASFADCRAQRVALARGIKAAFGRALARRSGTMHTACGRTLHAISTISAVAAISMLRGFFSTL